MVTSVHDSLIGQLVDGRYLVQERIALGGMATVYRATDKRLDRSVALKIMHPHLAKGTSGQSFVSRFRREARAAARLTHPGLVAVYDQGVDGEISYLTLEFVEGTDLRHILDTRGTLSVGKALAITEDTLDALAAAHRSSLVHRDVKPENILISNEHEVKITDFGLARAVTEVTSTTTGTLLGTVAYLAPEVVTTGVGDTRTDVYSVGIMLFEMLTGRQPFVGEAPIHVAYKHVNEDIPKPSTLVHWITPELDALVTSFAARNPEDRPRTASEALEDLREVLATLKPAQLQMRATPPQPASDAGSDKNPRTASVPAISDDNGLHLSDDTAAFVLLDEDLEPAEDSDDAVLVGEPENMRDDAADTREANQTVPLYVRNTQSTISLPISPNGQPSSSSSPGAQSSASSPHAATTAIPAIAAEAGGRPFEPGTDAALPAHPATPGGATHSTSTGTSPQSVTSAKSPRSSKTVAASNGKNQTTKNHAGRWIIVTLALLGILGGGYGGYYWWNNVGPGAYTTVPLDIVGVSKEDSADQFAGSSLTPKFSESFHDTVPAGEVIEATPNEGERVRKESSVAILVSKGIEMHTVPKGLVGKQFDVVQADLVSTGFSNVKETLKYSTNKKKGTVLELSEKEGATIPHNTELMVTVSNGPEPISIQQVVGETEESAKKLLEGWELKVKVKTKHDDTVPKGSVISQKPKQGTNGFRGDTVTITVSLGPELVDVPNVVGKRTAEATKILEDRGFDVKVNKYLDGFFDSVRFQDAKAGTQLPKGSTISLTVF